MSLRVHGAYVRGRQSSALILTLLFVSLVTILLVAFLGSMSLESDTSSSHLNHVEAGLYAQMASDFAAGQLESSLASTNGWVSQPGMVFSWPTNNTAATPTVVDLSSGEAATNASSDVAADLNPRTTSSYLIDPAGAQPMRVKWIYIYQDGTFTSAGLANFAQPVVGRFAYWVDDASCRINLNTAWTRATENTNDLSDPSQVELTSLLAASDADLIHTARGVTPFNSLLDAARAGGGVPQVLAQQPFSLTHYNHSPANLNMLGKPRILLTTQYKVAAANNSTNSFIDILNNPGTATAWGDDPGQRENLNAAKVQTAVNTIYSYLTNSAWPIASTSTATFANKYAPGNNVRAMQLAINIVEYVRCVESAKAYVDPLRGDISTSGFTVSYTAFDTNAILGNDRGPRFTQASFLWIPNTNVPTTTVASIPSITAKLAISLPPHCGIESVNLTNFYLGFQCNSGKNHPGVTGANWSFQPNWRIGVTECSPSTILTNGGTCFVTRTAKVLPALQTGFSTNPITLPTDGSDTLSARFYLADPTPAPPAQPDANATLYDVVPVVVGTSKSLNCLLDGTTYRPDDPSVNKRIKDWTNSAAFVSALGQPSTATPQQDTDASGAITNGGIVFSVPKGSPASASDPMSVSNPDGLVQSVGELGYVHTGIEANITATGFGVPYRTLRLQPERSGSTDLPDWALLDLFAAPIAPWAANAFTVPNAGSVGGQVNVNSQISTFTNSSGVSTVVRTAPLQSLFQNAAYVRGANPASLTSTQAAVAATNVLYHALASSGGNAGRTYGAGAMTNLYYSPGQLAEIAGVADGGEQSENVIRAVYGNAATAGNVFSIYVIGQSIKQDKTGVIHVLGEARAHRMMERINSGASAASFSPVFTQSLYP